MLRRTLLLIALLLGFPTHDRLHAQYIFLDTNGDGASTSLDRIDLVGSLTVDICLQTDKNRDGSSALCSDRIAIPVSIFSYEFLLHASGGTVEWGSYVNALPGMDFCFGEFKDGPDYYTGYLGSKIYPPGKYKLGTLTVRVTSGTPRIQFVSRVPRWPWVQTSFGSMNPGKDGANTLRYTDDPKTLGSANSDIPGDWADADGIGSSSAALASRLTSQPELRFGLEVAPNPLNPGATMTITTTRTGFVRVRLFDVSGRLVGVLLNSESVPPGRHTVRLNAVAKRPSELASGVYYYRVNATEGSLKGRVVVLK